MRLVIMVICLLLILLFPFHLMFAFPSVHPTCQSGERSALLQFKESFITDCQYASPSVPSAYPKVASWKLEGNASDCCSWHGVFCDEGTGHVVGLNLNASCLYGSIDSNSSLFRLVHLKKLNLANNDFKFSQIPSALGNLSELNLLQLTNSLFFGQIPSEISMLSKLTYLDLSSSYYEPPYFPEKLLELRKPDLTGLVQNLSSLEYLYLGSVDISSSIPAILTNLSSLRSIYLYNCGLSGILPDAVFQLPNLQFMWLNFNPTLTGHLPASLGKLHSIESLNIESCNFSGMIPFSVGNLTKLTYLVLGNNSLSDQIPISIGNLTQLLWLDFSSNKLQGSIPTSIFALKNLEYLDFYSNKLSGVVDLDPFLTLKNLKMLFLSLNNIVLLEKNRTNGTLAELTQLGMASCSLSAFPLSLRKQNKLEELDLSVNNIRGKIPSWMWTMSLGTLEYLDLSDNYLTGLDQSPTILPWSNLRMIDLSSNLLEGPLPVPPFSTTRYFTVSNSFSGEIPELICKASSLEILDLRKNNLNGSVPQCLGSISSLSILNLEDNILYGTIPQTWTNNSRVRMISLGQNKLQGQIPRSLASCKMLEILDLRNNQLNDTFPSWMGTLPELKILMLQYNSFQGKIGSPETSFFFPKLQILDLSTNNFVGKLPVDYFVCWHAMQVDVEKQLGYLQAPATLRLRSIVLSQWYYSYSMKMTNKGVEMDYWKILQVLKALDFSCNKFEGDIPEFIGNLKGLHLLNLSNNVLSGSIPSSIGNLVKLEALDLSQNKLSGEIPQQLVQLNFIVVFNVSHNHLTGPIPQGKQFDTFQNTSFDGNPGLCGEPLSVKCKNANILPATAPPISDESLGLDWKFVLIGYASGFVFGAVMGHLVIERKRDWFMKFFRVRQPRRQRRARRSRGN